MKDHIAEALSASLVWLNEGDYESSWRLVASDVSYDDRESEDRVELEWDDRLSRWAWLSSEDDPINTHDLVTLMTWATDVSIRVIAYDNNHHSNVIVINTEDGKVVDAG